MYRNIVLALLLIVSILIGSVWIGYATVTSQDIVEITSTAGDYNTTHYIFHLKVEYPAGSGNIYEAYAFMPKNLGYLEPFTLYLNWSFSGSDMRSYWVFIDSETYTPGSQSGEKYIRYDGWWELHPSSWNVSLYIKFDDYFNGPMAYTPGLLVSFTVPDTIVDNSEARYGDLIVRIYDPDTSDTYKVFVNGVKVFESQATIYYRHHLVDWWNRYINRADLGRAWVFAGEEFNISIRVYNDTGIEVYHRDIIYIAKPDNLAIKTSYKKPIANYPRLNIAIYDADPKDFPIIYRTYEVTFLSPSYITIYPKNPDPYTSYRKKTPFTLNITKGGFWDTGWYGGYGVQLTIVNEPKTIKFRIERVFDYNGNPVIINKTYTLSLGESSSSGDTTTTTTTREEEHSASQMICVNDTKIFINAVHKGLRNNKNVFKLNITRPIDTIVILEIIGKGIKVEGYGYFGDNATITLGNSTSNNTVSYDTPKLMVIPLGIRTIVISAGDTNTTDSLTILSDSQNVIVTVKEVIVNGTTILVNETLTLIGQGISYIQYLWNKYGLLLVAVPVFFIIILLALANAGRGRGRRR